MKLFCLFVALLGLAWLPAAIAQNPSAPVNNNAAGKSATVQQGTNVPPSGVLDSNDPLLQPPPLPPGKPSLVGGVVAKIDPVNQTLLVKPYGGGSMKIYFDDRTHIFRNGVETTMLGIRKGDRIYADTLLDGVHVFAKNLRVVTEIHPTASARGELLSYDPVAGRLELRDALSAQQVSVRVGHDTVVRQADRTASLADLRPGALVKIRFAPVSTGPDIAQEITIVAAPGSLFHFAGKVMYLDMSRGLMAVQNRTNDQSYEIHFDPANRVFQEVGIGSEVELSAVFDGSFYTAQSIIIAAGQGQANAKP